MLQLDILVLSSNKLCQILLLLTLLPSVSIWLLPWIYPCRWMLDIDAPSEEGQQHTQQYLFTCIEWEQEPNDPSWPLHVGIRSKRPVFRNLLAIWVILSVSPPVFQLAFFAKGQWEFTTEPSNMLTQPDNWFKQGNCKHSAQVWQAPVFFELTAYLTCLFWKHHAWSPWR